MASHCKTGKEACGICPLPCCKCEKPGTRWCDDCSDVYCDTCSTRIHQEGDEDHTLEELLATGPFGVRIVTPLLAQCFAVYLIFFAFQGHWIPDNYFDLEYDCHFLNTVRKRLAHIDGGMVHVQGAWFAEACATEDTFWRFYADFFVRSLATNTDSVVLLLSASWTVILSDCVVGNFIIPVTSLIYALVFEVFRRIEGKIPRTEVTSKAEELAKYMHICIVLDDPPPLTTWRYTPPKDLKDFLWYPVTRTFRAMLAAQENVSDRLSLLWHWSVIVTVFARLTCILLGKTWFVFAGICFLIWVFRFCDVRGVIQFHNFGAFAFWIACFYPVLIRLPGRYLKMKAYYADYACVDASSCNATMKPSEWFLWKAMETTVGMTKAHFVVLFTALIVLGGILAFIVPVINDWANEKYFKGSQDEDATGTDDESS
eukprot:TRINITY_DN63251_c0_g1_i1.p1 TRINITY_DN63251_c0_g1~~TRINITY_DN63251_c0_g1_i1.p1  ORF type:complete len:428 (+),score=60.14 TRINITY_DN63251_c0_g1_i1:68-1351(+)